MSTATVVSPQDVASILRDILASFAPDSGPKETVTPSETWIEAFVKISGDRNGEVVVAMWGQSAAHFAAAMTHRPFAEIGHDDAVDALCELANMVGGQVKSLLPGASRLGLPQLRMRRRSGPNGVEDHAALATSKEQWNGHPIRVTVSIA